MEQFFDRHIAEIIGWRRELHQIAEVSGNEKETAKKVEQILKSLNPTKIITGLGGHGLLALFGDPDEKPLTLFRAELDGLPIPDEIEADHRSRNPETGHKCGHDGHMAQLLGHGLWLMENPPRKGSVGLLFQPAEETGEGAALVLESDGFKNLDPDHIIALHNLPGYPKHQVVLRDGVFSSASCGAVIELHGRSSHAAHPEQGNSPVSAMTEIINMLQTLPGDGPMEETGAIVTIIHARLGERAFGTSPGNAVVMATLRAYETAQLDHMLDACERKSKEIAENHGLEITFETTERFEATENDPRLNATIRKVAEGHGLEVMEMDRPFRWSEDVGRFTGSFNGVLFGLGAGVKHPPLHSPEYDYPDELIETAIRIFSGMVGELNC